VIALGATSWRVDEIARDRVLVSPAPGEPGRLPFWRGEGPGRPVELGRALGALLRELGRGERGAAEAALNREGLLDPAAARDLLDHLEEQRAATGALPSDRTLVVERFRDELGDWRVCILSPFGARLHAPWALALEQGLAGAASAAAQIHWSDDGISLRLPDTEAAALPLAQLLPDPDALEARVVEALAGSALFAGQFRENAARALLLPRRRPGARTPLWSQRLRAQNLLAVAREYPAFPILLETYRSCLRDVFDLPALTGLLREVRAGAVRVHEVETRSPSPFARALAFEYTAAYLYQGDTPAAERRSAALVLDRAMLRELLGGESLRELLDAERVEVTERELQCLVTDRRARDPDALCDLLRRLGELSDEELRARCEVDPAVGLAELAAAGRVARVELAGSLRWIAAEDAGLYAGAFGVQAEGEIPETFREPAAEPLEQWSIRFAARRGPFTTAEAAARCGAPAAQLEAVFEALAAAGRLETGELDPRRGPGAREWCDREVLRTLRRRSLAALRAQVAPVDAASFARFLGEWQRVGAAAQTGGDPDARLRAALEQLEGCLLSVVELERSVLPARVPDYDPRQLDALGAAGEIVWIGSGSLGTRDGRVRLFRRETLAHGLEREAPESETSPLTRQLVALLEERGACFTGELLAELGAADVSELFDALREGAWSGLLTNDTFAALRALAAGRPARARSARRGRRPRANPLASGRWSAVSREIGAGADPTRRAHARALRLLERYGVVSREAAALEELRGGFGALGAVYREMERSGKLRGGRFVEDFEGAQFAWAGAVDRLRAARRSAPGPVLLAATDPASPFGALLPWPETVGDSAPRRAVGARVVIDDGVLALYLDASGRRLRCYATGPVLASALAELADRLAQRRGALRIEEIDGQPAPGSPLAPALEKAGFRRDYKALVLERSGRKGDVF